MPLARRMFPAGALFTGKWSLRLKFWARVVVLIVVRRYFVSGVEIWAPTDTGALIILGDSITDGRGSEDDQNNR